MKKGKKEKFPVIPSRVAIDPPSSLVEPLSLSNRERNSWTNIKDTFQGRQENFLHQSDRPAKSTLQKNSETEISARSAAYQD